MADAKDSFWWCKAETARELARRIDAAGTGLVRVEMRVDKARRGEPMTFRVVTNDAAKGEADLNDSWLCPPICPGGGGG
jgi:hypothetical protein